ncbi:PepSY domain-containing protein [Chitinophaga japonensis]|uniref:PepSY-associated transmembrane protein n=1 Tax=Chitinophaga japonensis TaxID=104662 RepID=A0A562SND9_CHIJA|nr:PepSY domain-containing protein [Chitinophaga japonensis]TWI82484.1 PepSY-associated transmembrane protein [Chitinophaga japonensis]
MRKKIYQVHRTLSLIIAVPVLLWAVSGFMHPLMTTLRPQVATQALPPLAVDSAQLQTDLATALRKNRIDSIACFRLVHIDTTWFYQVQLHNKQEPVYLSTINGRELTAGNWLYAQYLARQFLEGPALSDTTAPPVAVAEQESSLHDCCDAATNCVLNGSKGSQVRDASMLTAFNEEYKSINRLLPVYRVSFDRADGIRVYVETTQDRFAFAMDNRRAVFDTVFRLLHTWDWLNFSGKARLIILFLLAAAACFTTVLGLYIFFTTKSKKVKGNGRVSARRYHRYTALVAALFTLLWTFSGAWHALAKWKDDTRDRYFSRNSFRSDSLYLPFSALQQAVGSPLTNISPVKMEDGAYWQVYTKDTPVIRYLRMRDLALLPQGEQRYAAYLATLFSGNPPQAIREITPVTRFTDEYNFTDKRLPVWKVGYDVQRRERYYVETRSGRLSVRVDDADLPEGYSFALFHKHHFMDWGGKAARDYSTMIWALAQVVMVIAGLYLYFRIRSRAKI